MFTRNFHRIGFALVFFGLSCSQRPEPLFNFDQLAKQSSNPLEEMRKFDDQTRKSPSQKENGKEVPEYSSRASLPVSFFNYFDAVQDGQGSLYITGRLSGNGSTSLAKINQRLNAIDTSWGGAGFASTNNLFPVAITVDSQKQVYPIARVLVPGITGRWYSRVFRFSSRGTLDSSFGTAGLANVALTTQGGGTFTHSAVVDANGKLTGAGYTVNDGVARAFLFRLLPNGDLDTSFATRGFRLYGQGNQSSAIYDLQLTTTNRFVAAGVEGQGPKVNMTAWRINSNGTLNTAFNTQGFTAINFAGQSHGSTVTIDTNGKIYFTGSTADAGLRYGVTTRLLSSGRLDTTFNSTGIVLLTAQGYQAPWFVPGDKNPNGKFTVAYGSYLARFHTDGSVDTAFFPSLSVMSVHDPVALSVDSRNQAWGIYSYTSGVVSSEVILVPQVYHLTEFYNSPSASENVDFGFVRANSQAISKKVVLNNFGFQTIGTLTVSGPSGPFSFEGGYPGTGGTCGASLGTAPCQLVVTFSTSAQGRYNDNISLTYSADGLTHTVNVPLTAAASQLGVSDFPTYNLGNFNSGCNSNGHTFTVTNYGSTDIALNTTATYGNSTAQFEITTNGCIGTLGAGQTCNFTLTGYTVDQTDCLLHTTDDMRFEISNGADEGITTMVYGGF